MSDFAQFNLAEQLNHTLEHLNFTKPTIIQEKTIPVALQGHDIIAQSQTGSGKTLAFAIPIITKILLDKQAQALVITPTRELAVQIMEQIQSLLGKKSKVKTAILIGGQAIFKQFSQLKLNPQIIIGTPGRINDHLKRKSLNLANTKYLVLDETDRMLDMGFQWQIEDILHFIKGKKQTLLFSATMPDKTLKIAQKYLHEPRIIKNKSQNLTPDNITQEAMIVNQSEKYQALQNEVSCREGSIVVFAKTKFACERLAKKLAQTGQSASAMHGDFKQSKRQKIITDFRNKKIRILIATDVAARGLDVPHIKHVINYDIPQCLEDYIHRIGRTARALAKGDAISFFGKGERYQLSKIEKLVGKKLLLKKLNLKNNAASNATSNEDGKSKKYHSDVASQNINNYFDDEPQDKKIKRQYKKKSSNLETNKLETNKLGTNKKSKIKSKVRQKNLKNKGKRRVKKLDNDGNSYVFASENDRDKTRKSSATTNTKGSAKTNAKGSATTNINKKVNNKSFRQSEETTKSNLDNYSDKGSSKRSSKNFDKRSKNQGAEKKFEKNSEKNSEKKFDTRFKKTKSASFIKGGNKSSKNISSKKRTKHSVTV